MKRKNATNISAREREAVMMRDYGCIFCQVHYRMDKAEPYELNIGEVMHFIPRSQGGLGIRENLALGCKYHHTMFDNGFYREEMKVIFEDYLKRIYPGWNKKDLIYDKWKELK